MSAHGDRKKALAILCTQGTQKSHYFATYRTGLALGLAVPALVSGLYNSKSRFTLSSCRVAHCHLSQAMTNRLEMRYQDGEYYFSCTASFSCLFFLLLLLVSISSHGPEHELTMFLYLVSVRPTFSLILLIPISELEVRTKLDYRAYFEVRSASSYNLLFQTQLSRFRPFCSPPFATRSGSRLLA
jgi:hypothetical protein